MIWDRGGCDQSKVRLSGQGRSEVLGLDIVELKLLGIRKEKKWRGFWIYEYGYGRETCARDGKLGITRIEMPVNAMTLRS